MILTSSDVQYDVTYQSYLFLMRTWLRIFNSACSDFCNVHHHTRAMNDHYMGTLTKFWSFLVLIANAQMTPKMLMLTYRAGLDVIYNHTL